MTKNVIAALVAVATIGIAPVVSAKSSSPTISPSEIASFCQQSYARPSNDVLLNAGEGNLVSITIHCDTATTVGMNSDTGETEQGPTEAAENGVED